MNTIRPALTGTMHFNKTCELEDFADPELREIIREVFSYEIPKFTPDFPRGVEYRKYWEVAMTVRALRHFGLLRRGARILGVGAGTEVTSFYLTRHVGEVVATDIYEASGHWISYAPRDMLTRPEQFAPCDFERERLTVLHMNGCDLRFPDDTFDGIYSSGSIEHFGTLQDIATSAYEMGRVLKPGGILTLSTEFAIDGPPDGDGWEGVRLLRREHLLRYVVEASGLELVDALDTDVSEATLASRWELTRYTDESDRQVREHGHYPRMGEIIWTHYPHLVLTHAGYTFGSVHLTLRKTDRYRSMANGWARPAAASNGAHASNGLAHQPAAASPSALRPVAPGVNFIGDLLNDSGLGEAGRKTLDAMLRHGLPVSRIDLPYDFYQTVRDHDPAYSRLPTGSRFPINLLFYNLHQLASLDPGRLRELTQGKYTIGYWFWELPEVPPEFRPAFARVDEIWVASRYCQQILARYASGPVNVIPLPVEVITSTRPDRGRFGIPHGRYVFLFSLTLAGSLARKNPWGVVTAFERAFGTPGPDGPLLVAKLQHPDAAPELRAELRAAVERRGGIVLEEAYTRQEMNDLLACADAYVSLHRAEGFGLGMAESMYLGKPVIGTGFSANVDFMNAENSYPVGYRLRPVAADDHRRQPAIAGYYPPGQSWAEPDLDDAARLMRHLYEHQEEGRRRGQRAAADIRGYCGPAAVGPLIERRLAQLRPAGPAAVDSVSPSSRPAMPEPIVELQSGGVSVETDLRRNISQQAISLQALAAQIAALSDRESALASAGARQHAQRDQELEWLSVRNAQLEAQIAFMRSTRVWRLAERYWIFRDRWKARWWRIRHWGRGAA